MIATAPFFKPPMARQPFAKLPLGAVRPRGWLLDQLEVQAKGLSGRLFELWPDDVGENCAWLGGSGDGWERAPYYLDGLVPLSRLLNSAPLTALADRYISAMVASQREDGPFGPENDDWWPRMVVCKAMLQHLGATGDESTLAFLLRYMAYQKKTLDKQPLREWAIPRACEGALCALELHALTGKPFLLELAGALLRQGIDWTSFFHSFPYTQDLKKTLPWKELSAMRKNPQTPEAARYAFLSYHQSHGVNLAMALKAPALAHALSGGLKESQAAEIGFDRLMKHHGVANGLFTCDEHLSGNAPSQGAETCAVVEAMFSMETLLSLTGSAAWGDRLEKLAFGALPAALTADMLCHQYDQQVNQTLVSKEPRNWYNNSDDSNLFGFEPNFGCCTANYHQGWPKFASSLWMESADGGLAAQSYAPCAVKWHVNRRPVSVEVTGGYPFGGDVRIEFTKADAEFPLHLRIPAWAEAAHCLVNGETAGEPAAGEYLVLNRAWKTGDVVELFLPMQPRVTRWSHQSASIERGPVLYALKIQEEWTKEGEREIPDWSVRPASAWQYALLPDVPIEEIPGEAAPFGAGKPPALRTKAVPLPSWGMKGGSASSPPVLPKVDPEKAVDVELVPYGATALRIAQFPMGRRL